MRYLALYSETRVVTQRHRRATDARYCAWRISKFVKSNAIVYAKDRMGVGAGQMSRIDRAAYRRIKPHRAWKCPAR